MGGRGAGGGGGAKGGGGGGGAAGQSSAEMGDDMLKLQKKMIPMRKAGKIDNPTYKGLFSKWNKLRKAQAAAIAKGL